MKRPWRIVIHRLGLTADILSTYSTKERALSALPKTRNLYRGIGFDPNRIYVMDPTGKRVPEEDA